MMLSFYVPGKPQSQGSKVKTRWGMREDNKELGPWRERVALAAYAALPEDRDDDELGITGPVTVGLEFVLYRPGNTAKTKPTPPAIKKPDIDKLVRAILDALTGVVWHDDAQVTTLLVRKRIAEIGEPMGVRIHITPDLTCYLDDEGATDGAETRKVTG